MSVQQGVTPVIQGDVFIISNSMKSGNMDDAKRLASISGGCSATPREYVFNGSSRTQLVKQLGEDDLKSRFYFQACVINDESDNWCCHSYNKFKEGFPQYLSVEPCQRQKRRRHCRAKYQWNSGAP